MQLGKNARASLRGRIPLRGATGATRRVTIRRGGLLLLPQDLVSWRVGQRVFFAAIDGGVVMSTYLRRTWSGRICSARIRSIRIPERLYSLKK